MPTQVTNYQCPACTGPLHFSAETGKLTCDYCGSAYDVAEIEALYAQKEAEAAAAKEVLGLRLQSISVFFSVIGILSISASVHTARVTQHSTARDGSHRSAETLQHTCYRGSLKRNTSGKTGGKRGNGFHNGRYGENDNGKNAKVYKQDTVIFSTLSCRGKI